MPNDNTKADVDISVTDELDAADAAVISDGLRAHYVSQAGYYDFRPLAVFVRDRQTGGSSAGPRAIRIWARLRRLVLPARGSAACWDRQPGGGDGGRRGRRRGCTRIALTLSIEAPGFYLKQGYDVAANSAPRPMN